MTLQGRQERDRSAFCIGFWIDVQAVKQVGENP